MTPRGYSWLVARALFELVRYDVMYGLCGFGRVRSSLSRQATRNAAHAGDCEATVCAAVLLATCLYWKPVRCLQRSVVATRMLRRHGVPARLVIGYRQAPFFSHAWVEVGSRVVNDSPVYRQRLQVLHSI